MDSGPREDAVSGRRRRGRQLCKLSGVSPPGYPQPPARSGAPPRPLSLGCATILDPAPGPGENFRCAPRDCGLPVRAAPSRPPSAPANPRALPWPSPTGSGVTSAQTLPRRQSALAWLGSARRSLTSGGPAARWLVTKVTTETPSPQLVVDLRGVGAVARSGPGLLKSFQEMLHAKELCVQKITKHEALLRANQPSSIYNRKCLLRRTATDQESPLFSLQRICRSAKLAGLGMKFAGRNWGMLNSSGL
nr:uncharacterized protein LOC129051469 [Pongo abelii]